MDRVFYNVIAQTRGDEDPMCSVVHDDTYRILEPGVPVPAGADYVGTLQECWEEYARLNLELNIRMARRSVCL